MLQLSKISIPSMKKLASLEKSYELCRQTTAQYAKTFYLGTLLMSEVKRRAVWAIYAWCRQTDELVDGFQAKSTTQETLERWEKQLESVFTGNPVDDQDVALVDTLQRFQLDIKPFREMIAGQRMDLERNRYQTFDDLYLYCYRVAGTVGLMSTAIMGVDVKAYSSPWKKDQEIYTPYPEAIALGIANQLTNILRDVGEDIKRGRIYLPLQELALFNYTEQDLLKGIIDDRWREFMKFQIQRARKFYAEAEKGISLLSADARLPVWAALMLYSQILDVIENNDYDVFNKRAFVPSSRKFISLPVAYIKALVL
ncbi:MAG TPA: phytoene synthase [Allocoleopsis sp.]